MTTESLVTWDCYGWPNGDCTATCTEPFEDHGWSIRGDVVMCPECLDVFDDAFAEALKNLPEPTDWFDD